MTSTTAPTPKPGTARRRAALAVLPAAVLMLVAACSTGDPSADPTTTNPVPPSVSWPPSSPSATAKDPVAGSRAAAFADAKDNYSTWFGMQPNERADVPQKAHQVATKKAITAANQGNKELFTKGVKVTGGSRIIWMKNASYSPTRVSLHTCVGSRGRILKDGKDVTIDKSGKPVPKGQEARIAFVVTFATPDGGTTWKVDTVQAQEKSC